MTDNAELISRLRAAAKERTAGMILPDDLIEWIAADALESAKAAIASLESERKFLVEEIAYCVERLRKAGVKDGTREMKP